MDIKKILLVDDERHGRRIAEICLSAVPEWQVTAAGSGKEALEVAEKLMPDLVLLDLCMPEMDGVATLRKLRENPATAKIAVILLTGAESEESDVAVAALSVIGTILKRNPSTLPADIRALTKSI
jgi:CheY-like chemotaxis protein